jgi:hypothetical protein
MSISIRSFSLKCLKNTLSLYTTRTASLNLYRSTTSSLNKIVCNPAVNYMTLKNIRLYSSSPISWDEVDNIIANNVNEPKKENVMKTKGMKKIVIFIFYYSPIK